MTLLNLQPNQLLVASPLRPVLLSDRIASRVEGGKSGRVLRPPQVLLGGDHLIDREHTDKQVTEGLPCNHAASAPIT